MTYFSNTADREEPWIEEESAVEVLKECIKAAMICPKYGSLPCTIVGLEVELKKKEIKRSEGEGYSLRRQQGKHDRQTSRPQAPAVFTSSL